MDDSDNLAAFLSNRLPRGIHIRLYHVSTAPTPCPPIFSPGPGRSEKATTVESHFFAIARSRQQPDSSLDQPAELMVLGIEVLIFATTDLTTVFVSKADSTGFLERSVTDAPRRTSLAQTAITAFLEFLLKPRLDRHRLVLSLFARAQNQYLFPGSIENGTKHVLDDRQLIKWWCRILDPLARQLQTDASQSVKAHVVVPGCDSSETKVFFPPSSRTDSASAPMWVNAYPVDLLVHDTSLPPRCLVPRLPDDPKSRFLDDLDAQRDEHDSWRGIQTLDQFWEMMSYRQECSAGRLVGFVWLLFIHANVSKRTVEDVNDEIFTLRAQRDRWDHTPNDRVTTMPTSSTIAGHSLPIDPVPTRLTASPPEIFTNAAATITDESSTPKGKFTSPRQSQSNVSVVEKPLQLAPSKIVTSSQFGSPSELVLSPEAYQELMVELLELDFAGEQTAAESSNKWRMRAMQLADASQFGVHVDGAAVESDAALAVADTATKNINVLTGVRKKRKAASAEIAGINTLATDLVRKKPKG